ncbi:hypothetical protein EMIT0P44_60123 [Pseudomonas sp. IT-P44]
MGEFSICGGDTGPVGAWLASDGGLKGGAEFEVAIASKLAPTGGRVNSVGAGLLAMFLASPQRNAG